MTESELNKLEIYFFKEDFRFEEGEKYCGHKVVDERDGYVTAKAVGINIPVVEDFVLTNMSKLKEPVFKYCTKTLEDIQNITPKRAPQPVTQKGI